MADYSQQTWVDDDGTDTLGTVITKALMDHIEAGVKDAAEHNRIGPLSSRPAAAAGNKNWLWVATDTDGTGGLYLSDGATWTKMPVGSLPLVTRFGSTSLGELRAGTIAVVLAVNHDSVADRQIDNTKPSWRILMDMTNDLMYCQRAPATNANVAPTWAAITTLSSSNLMQIATARVQFGSGGELRSEAADYSAVSSNYNSITDRLIDTTKPGWRLSLGVSADTVTIQRAPATAGSPAFTDALKLDNAGNPIMAGANPRFGSGGALNSFTSAYTILRSNYNGVTDRLIDTTRPSWTVELDGRAGFDRVTIERAPATAGSPVNERLCAVSLDGVGQFFGDGSDGIGVADATVPTALAGATRSGNRYTLTRDVYFLDLTITASVIITNGYRIFVKRNLSGNGSIIADGTDGTNASAGVAGVGGSGGNAGSIAGTANTGGGGGTGGAGAAAGGAPVGTVSLGGGGSGGNGGNGTGGANVGAAGSVPVAVPGGARRSAADMIFPIAWRFTGTVGAAMIGGGGSGGGGGGATGGGGGGGGGGAGVVMVAARYLTGSVSFTAKGGNGGNGAVNGGGGGGGGGGLIHLLYSSKQGQGGEGAWTGTATANGGNAGTGNGTGANGTAGAAGTVVQLPVI